MNTIPVTVQLLNVCTSDYFQGFSGPTIAIPVDARTGARELRDSLEKADEWPTGLTNEEIAQAVVSTIGDTALHRNTHLFPDVGPNEAPTGAWISEGGEDEWFIIDKADGALDGPYPTEKHALCEAWDGEGDHPTVYAYFGISLEMPEGYRLDKHVDGIRWAFMSPTDKNYRESYSTEMEAKVAAWRDHLSAGEAFKREERYIVVKRSDLTPFDEEMLLKWIRKFGAEPRECVVVEADWPIYEDVWGMVERLAKASGGTQ